MEPVAREAQQQGTVAAIVLLVIALVLWNRRRRGRGPRDCHPWSRALCTRCCPCAFVDRGVARVRFDTNDACLAVNDLTMLPQEQKAERWYQQDDFDDFLKDHVRIRRAYRAAARKLGVETKQVSSVGSHGSEGYKAMMEAFPELANESRRGLGLGRSRQRGWNRDAYIAAVLAEQERQREEAWEEGLDDTDATPRPIELDVEALAVVAACFSQQDRAHAALLARQHFEQHEEEGGCQRAEATPNQHEPDAALNQHELEAALNRLAAGPSRSPGQSETSLSRLPVQRQNCAVSDSSKGFGLSRDRLQQAGLSPSGHALSLYQRLRRLPPAIDFRNAGATTSENDEEDEEESVGFTDSETSGKDWYHSVRTVRTMSGPCTQLKVAAPLGMKTQAYGTRQEYRNWRALAKIS